MGRRYIGRDEIWGMSVFKNVLIIIEEGMRDGRLLCITIYVQMPSNPAEIEYCNIDAC